MEVIVADVLDGRTFVTTSNTTVVLKDVAVPGLMSVEGRRAKARLEELVLHQRMECEEVEDDSEGRIIAVVRVEGENVNEAILRLISPAAPPEGRGGDAASTSKPKKIEITFDESAFGVKPPKAR